jgi:hypothetical protein
MLCDKILSSGSATVGTEVTLLLSQDLGNGLHDTKKGGPTPFISSYHDPSSHLPVIRTLIFFHLFLEPESLTSGLCTLRRSSSSHHTFLSCLFQQVCVWLKFPARGQVWKPYRWVLCPIPSLTLEEVFPPTSLTVIHLWVRGLFWS